MASQPPVARYIVIHHDGAWRINLANLYYGPYESREAAVTAALATAKDAQAQGHHALVMAAEERGLFTTLWDSAA
jgi:hypothetical protein